MSLLKTPPAPNGVRPPNPEELQELHAWLCDHSLGEVFEDWYAGAWIAVFDNYITDGPGYVGKVMSVVWGGSPDIYDVFLWRDGRMVVCQHDGDAARSSEVSPAAEELFYDIVEATESLTYDDGDMMGKLNAHVIALDAIRDLAYRGRKLASR